MRVPNWVMLSPSDKDCIYCAVALTKHPRAVVLLDIQHIQQCAWLWCHSLMMALCLSADIPDGSHWLISYFMGKTKAGQYYIRAKNLGQQHLQFRNGRSWSHLRAKSPVRSAVLNHIRYVFPKYKIFTILRLSFSSHYLLVFTQYL